MPARHNVAADEKGMAHILATLLFAVVLVILSLTFYRIYHLHHQSAFGVKSASSLASPLSNEQRANFGSLAAKTWQFYGADVDSHTSLPRNNIVPSDPTKNGDYTSGTEIGFYLDSIVAAKDLNIISAEQAQSKAAELLTTLQHLATYQGFPYRWYDTTIAQPIANPAGEPLNSEGSGSSGSSSSGFVSSVDDAWYTQSLVVARQAFPQLSSQFTQLLNAMNWKLLYDGSKNQMYIGYTVGEGPTRGTYNLLYGGTRIVAYMAIGSKTVPGSMWWGMNTTPPARIGQSQTPQGQDVSYADPQNGAVFNVFEGHYTYANIQFVPTWAGSLFQALAPNLVIPEEAWAAHSFAINNVNTALAQRMYATNSLRYPVWGLAPATTYNQIDGYAQYGAPGLAIKLGKKQAVPDDGVTPYASLLSASLLPQAVYANVATLESKYSGINAGPYGLYDSVNPLSGQIAQRYMDVSQGAILMGIDNVLNDNKLQSYIGDDAYGQAIKPYLELENFQIAAAQ